MAPFAGISDLFIIDSVHEPAILVRDSDGVPSIVDPQPLVLRAEYLNEDVLESQLGRAQERLRQAECDLFVPFPSLDGPPYRSGKLFTFQSSKSAVTWKDEHGSGRFGAEMRHFRVATPLGSYSWRNAWLKGGAGYFVTGDSGDTSLWSLFRLETDALGHQVFTLAPVRFSQRCPSVDFGTIESPVIRHELTQQYANLCRLAAQGAYRAVATHARNIVETLVAVKLGADAGRTLGDSLIGVKKLLEGSRRAGCAWGDLEYHLCHRVRLIHGLTHPTNTTTSARPIEPEFALSTLEDLAELLRIWGFSK